MSDDDDFTKERQGIGTQTYVRMIVRISFKTAWNKNQHEGHAISVIFFFFRLDRTIWRKEHDDDTRI